MFHFISSDVSSLSLFAAQATPGAPVNGRVVKLAIDSFKELPSTDRRKFLANWMS